MVRSSSFFSYFCTLIRLWLFFPSSHQRYRAFFSSHTIGMMLFCTIFFFFVSGGGPHVMSFEALPLFPFRWGCRVSLPSPPSTVTSLNYTPKARLIPFLFPPPRCSRSRLLRTPLPPPLLVRTAKALRSPEFDSE